MEVNEPRASYKFARRLRTDIGELPADWSVQSIGSLAHTSSGTTPPRSQMERYYASGTHAWVKTLDLNNGELWSTDEAVTDAALQETSLQLYPAGSVLIAMYGGLRQIGRTGLLRVPAAVNQAITAIQPREGSLVPEFLLASLNFRVDHWKSVASSSRKDPNITSADVRAFKLAVPSMGEQSAIAKTLADINALIASLEQLLTKKRQIKQGAMQELLTGKRRLPGFTTAWQKAQLSQIGWFLKGAGVKRDQASGGDLPCVRYGEIYTEHSDYIRNFKSWISAEVASASTELRRGDLLFAGSGETKEEIGKCVAFLADGPAYAGGDIVVLRPTVEVDSMFLGYLLNTPQVVRQKASRGQGDAVVHISAAALGQIGMHLPELREQASIAKVLFDMDTEVTALELRLAKARNLKQAMAQALLTGRIRLVEPQAA
jgi:type I restriction enzyme S subunit